MTRVIWPICALLLLISSARADRLKARELYEKGTKAYNLQEYARALDLFKQAYEQQSDSVLLFNIAQCQRQLGQYEAASKSYRVFLNETPNAPNRTEVQKQIKAMDEAAREQRGREPPMGTQPPSDNPPVNTTPPPPQTEPPPIVKTEKTEAPRPWYKNYPAVGVTAAGVVLVAVGAGLTGFGWARRADQDSLPSLPERNSAADDAGVFRPTGYALLGVGGAALVTGIVLFVVKPARPAANALHIEPTGDGLRVTF
jgi:tetratricopeptide (TPR) repeat protein